MSEESIAAIGNYFGLPATKVYGIATFYDYFTFYPRQGELIRICNGTSCHMHGSGKLAREVEKAVQQIGQKSRTRITVKHCECQGACDAGPIMQVNDVVITRANPAEVRSYIQRGIAAELGGGL
jgi:NADH-quinone oxidoreductase subunit E